MARILVRAAYAFDDVPRGSEAWVEDNPRVQGLIARGAFEVLDREPAPREEVTEDGAPSLEQPGPAEDVQRSGQESD